MEKEEKSLRSSIQTSIQACSLLVIMTTTTAHTTTITTIHTHHLTHTPSTITTTHIPLKIHPVTMACMVTMIP